uniref:Uncharacterized protein n=1 Tax=Anguilla anguilla TaxID=7936 RepID=A0A0E9QPV6_ANGAN
MFVVAMANIVGLFGYSTVT